MTDNSNLLNESESTSDTPENLSEAPVSITFFRILICFTILGFCFWLKSKNIKLFNDISYMYKSKICYNSITPERIHDELKKMYFFITSNINQIYLIFKK